MEETNHQTSYANAYELFANFVQSLETKFEFACKRTLDLPISSSTPINKCNGQTNGLEELDKQNNYEQDVELNPNFTTINERIKFFISIEKQLEQEGNKHVLETQLLVIDENDQEKRKVDDLRQRWLDLLLDSKTARVEVEKCPNGPIRSKRTNVLRHIGPQKRNITYSVMNSARKILRRRPMSFPYEGGMFEWDNHLSTITLTGIQKQNQDTDLDSVDEEATRDLTEFGEYYEKWLSEGESCTTKDIVFHSRPPSVEPDKPEIAKATITQTDPLDFMPYNLLMLTAPSEMISVDATKCHDNYWQQKRNVKTNHWHLLRYIIAICFFLVFTFYDPPQLHKSYHYTSPPV